MKHPVCKTDMPIHSPPSPASPVTTWILVIPCVPQHSHTTAETSHHWKPPVKSVTRYIANSCPVHQWEQKLLPTKMMGYTGYRKVLSLVNVCKKHTHVDNSHAVNNKRSFPWSWSCQLQSHWEVIQI